MNRQLIAVVLGVITLFAVVAVYLVLGPTEEASAPIEAEPIMINTATTVNSTTEPAPVATKPNDNQETIAEATTVPNEATAPPTDTSSTDEEMADIGLLNIYTIEPAQSEVRFILNELLRGQPTTVIGVSNQVAGELAFNLADLTAAQVGTIKVNARTLATDSSNRNRAIRNFILNTDTFEFITFTPTEIGGLAGSAAIGDTFEFDIIGDLTIRDITLSQRFTVVATVSSATEITGSATTTVARADYNLIIPSVPSVANVDEDVRLEIDFVAIRK